MAGDIEGPHMLVFRPARWGLPGGHRDDNLSCRSNFTTRRKGRGRRAVGRRAPQGFARRSKYGADLIKVCASGGVLSKGDQPGTPQYTLEELQGPSAEEAHKPGTQSGRGTPHGTQID